MFVTIITDCKGENEAGRQIARFTSLDLGPANLIGVNSSLDDNSTVEAAGNLIDILDATEGKKGIVVVNIAPRGESKDNENGSGFCYFYHQHTLVIATTKGHTLSLVKKLGISSEVKLLDIPKVLEHAIFAGLITAKHAADIKNSQFRSFEFVPRVAKWLLQGINLPSNNTTIEQFDNIPNCIWHIDTFGNAKTTLTLEDINSKSRSERAQRVEGPQNEKIPQQAQNGAVVVETNLGKFKYYDRLKDVPAGETAIYTGSSGIGSKRFIEIATQGVAGSAVKTLHLKVGDRLEIM